MTSNEKMDTKPLSDPKINQSEEDDDDVIPDGGWGWMVCFGSFIINFVLDGTMFSFGVLMIELLDYFGESKSKTALVGSTQLGMSMLMGPVVSYLLHRFSCRQITVFGSVLSTIGFVGSMFAPSVDILILTYGVIGGIGFNMIFLPALIIVGLYFNKKRAIATGIATSGAGVGTFVYGYVCNQILVLYSWRGTILILSGLVLNCMVCGFLFRPVVEERLKRKFKRQNNSRSTLSSGYGGSMTDVEDKGFNECHEPLITNKPIVKNNNRLVPTSFNFQAPRCKESLSGFKTSFAGIPSVVLSDIASPKYKPRLMSPSIPSYLLQTDITRATRSAENIRNVDIPKTSRLHSSSYHIPSCQDDVQTVRIRKGLSRPMLRKDILYSGSVMNLPEFSHSKSLLQFVADMTEDSIDESQSQSSWRPHKRCIWLMEWLRDNLGVQLFKNPVFLLLLVTCTMWTVHSVPVTFIPIYGISRDLDRTQASFLISILGITNTLGRIIAGVVTDIFKVRSIIIYSFALALASTINFIFPLCGSFALLAVCSGIFGLCMACAVSMRTIVLADNLGIENLTSSFGLIAMFQGIFFIIAPPVAGKLYDITSTYTAPFAMAGCLYAISCLTSVIVACIRRRKSSDPVVISVEEVSP